MAAPLASVVVARGLSDWGSRALGHWLSSCSTWAQLLHGMWNLSGLGIQPVSPALVGEFFTTELPGKPYFSSFEISTLLLTKGPGSHLTPHSFNSNITWTACRSLLP